jgi:hypothetical protein
VVEAVADFAASCNLPRDQRLGMQHLRSTFAAMLQRARDHNDPNVVMTKEVVYGFVEEIGMRNTWTRYAALAQKK